MHAKKTTTFMHDTSPTVRIHYDRTEQRATNTINQSHHYPLKMYSSGGNFNFQPNGPEHQCGSGTWNIPDGSQFTNMNRVETVGSELALKEVIQTTEDQAKQTQNDVMTLIKLLFSGDLFRPPSHNQYGILLTQRSINNITPVANGLGNDFIVALRPVWGTQNLFLYRQVPASFNAAIVPWNCGIVWSLVWDSERFVRNEQQLSIQPNAGKAFSIGRVINYQLIVQAATVNVAGANLSGQLTAAVLSDNRDAEDFAATKVATMTTNSRKDAVLNAPARDGIALIMGPNSTEMMPVDFTRVDGDGLAAYEYASQSQNFKPQNFASYGQISTQPNLFNGTTTPQEAGTQITAQNIIDVNSNMIWISSAVDLIGAPASLSPVPQVSAVPQVTRINIGPTGQENVPKFEVKFRVPVNTSVPSPVNSNTPIQALAPANPFEVVAKHIFVQASTVTAIALRYAEVVERKAVVPPAQDFNAPYVTFPFYLSPQGTTAGVWSYAGDVTGQTAIVTLKFEPQRMDGYTWVGTMIQGIDSTIYPGQFISGGSPLPVPGNTYGSYYMTAPWFRVDNVSMSNVEPISPGNASVPWFAIATSAGTGAWVGLTALDTVRPKIMDVKITIPRLYDVGNLGDYCVARMTGLGAGQSFNITAEILGEFRATGTTNQVAGKGHTYPTFESDRAWRILQHLWRSSASQLKRAYTLLEYKEVQNQVARVKTFQDVIKLGMFSMDEATKHGLYGGAGIFGKLDPIGMIQDAVSGIAHEAKHAITSNVMPEVGRIMKETVIPMALEAAKTAARTALAGADATFAAKRQRYTESAGAYGDHESDAMFGSAAGMFGAEEDSEDEDDNAAAAMFGEEGDDTKAQFGRRSWKGGLTQWAQLGGVDAGLLAGQLMSMKDLIRTLTRWSGKNGIIPHDVQALRAIAAAKAGAMDAVKIANPINTAALDNVFAAVNTASRTRAWQSRKTITDKYGSDVLSRPYRTGQLSIMPVRNAQELNAYLVALNKQGLYVGDSSTAKRTLAQLWPQGSTSTTESFVSSYGKGSSLTRALQFQFIGLIGTAFVWKESPATMKQFASEFFVPVNLTGDIALAVERYQHEQRRLAAKGPQVTYEGDRAGYFVDLGERASGRQQFTSRISGTHVKSEDLPDQQRRRTERAAASAAASAATSAGDGDVPVSGSAMYAQNSYL